MMEIAKEWVPQFKEFLTVQLADADAAHDIAHISRVVETAVQLAEIEHANMAVVVPAAWLHDCVTFAKNSPKRSHASRAAAVAAGEFLTEIGYPANLIPQIQHAIEAHSFSAGIPPETIEAKVVQDADRLDSIGAIGVARCLLTGASMGASLYEVEDPFAARRDLDDKSFSVDHFYVKLFKLVGMMNTAAGKQEGESRTAFMRQFLLQLGHELGVDASTVNRD